MEIAQSWEVTNRNDDSSLAIAAAWSRPENQIIRKDDEKSVLKAINNLPKTMQKTALLYIFSDLKLKDIAKHLACPEGTDRSRIFRIKKY